jgi:hypothetical protein
MRALRWRASLALAVLWTPAGGSALASELLVMPYACIMAGGRPLLAAGPEQGHQIIGRREQRTFTACSPANPDMCRTWTVHRFDLDCDGARVAWTAVVAAANHDRRAQRVWLDDGRLVLRMPRAWSYDDDDPCARRPKFFEGFGRMRRYCDERRADVPPPIVEMPMGFAPMLGIDGVFVKSALPSAGAENSQPAPAVLGPPAVAEAPEPSSKVARSETPPTPRAERAPAPTRETKPAPAPAAKVTIPLPPKAAAPPPVQSGGPVAPKIINRPDASPEPSPAAAPTPAPKAVPPAPRAVAEVPPPQQDWTPKVTATAPVNTQTSRDDNPATISLLSFVASPAVGAFAAFMVLTSALLAAFIVVRRREQLQADTRPRDVAGAQLYRQRPGRSTGAHGIAPRSPPASPPVPPAPAQPASPALGESMPRTRNEAIQVLGMGVMSSASEAALKKIVDGLRQSWHPDLARTEADRRLREVRMKQINVAWEILQGKRGAA